MTPHKNSSLLTLPKGQGTGEHRARWLILRILDALRVHPSSCKLSEPNHQSSPGDPLLHIVGTAPVRGHHE